MPTSAPVPDLSLSPAEQARAGLVATESLWFDAVLRPHRSLAPRGFGFLMTAVLAISTAAALRFSVIGAWPVAVFFVVDAALIYGAFRWSYATGQAFECIQLKKRALVVTKVSWRGGVKTETFQPFWVRAELDEEDGDHPRLILSSHGRHVEVGECLTGAERRELAGALSVALDRHRCGQNSVQARAGPD